MTENLRGSTKNDEARRNLFNYAMQGKWDKAMEVYKLHPWLRSEKITVDGETALHIAVRDHKGGVVEEMIELITTTSTPEQCDVVLKSENEQGNTPLHLAASIGNVPMCKCLVRKCKDLVSICNRDRENPFFLAVRQGKIEAFLCLLNEASESDRASCIRLRNKKGKTILHRAVAGGHFKLAFLIIEMYKDLGSTYDEKGVSPLHLLARQHTAFRSRTRLSLTDKIIYHCIYVSPWYPGDTGKSNGLEERLWGNIKGLFFLTVTFVKRCINPPDRVKAENSRTDLDEERPAMAISKQGPGSISDDIRSFPVNYDTCFNLIIFLINASLFLLSLAIGRRYVSKIQNKKEKNIWSAKVLEKLLDKGRGNWYDSTGKNPLYKDRTIRYEGEEEAGWSDLPADAPEKDQSFKEGNETKDQKKGKSETPIELPANNGNENKDKTKGKLETPILMAAKNGIKEMVERILVCSPMAIHDVSSDKKNIVLLAVENRHPHVYKVLLKRVSYLTDSVFGEVDKDGNSALHLAAMFSDDKPWLTPGAALQMQWEVKWFEYVKNSMPPNFFRNRNNKKESAQKIFSEKHQDLVQKGGEWLNNTATSCSVVSTLIATVAFATSVTLPGGNRESTGVPVLELKPAFHLYAISSLVALCFSVTSTVMFLAILTSRHREKDFARDLPVKLLAGLTSLFVSILAVLVSFCSAHFFALQKELRSYALPLYAVTCLPATLFAIAQLPLYIDLIWVIFNRVPQPSLEDNT